jgi:hypothetical protein
MCSGPSHVMLRQNIIAVRCLRGGQTKFDGVILNPNEKSMQSSGWVSQCFATTGKCILVVCYYDVFLGGCVLSLCAGSGSLIETCMHTNRSCIAVEIDGNIIIFSLLLCDL